MNGTRKGHFKLTPNVRYALSEGDTLVVADIPCKYMKSISEAPYTAKGTVTQNLQERWSDALRENGDNLNTGSTKNIAVSTKTKDRPDSEVTRGTPARTSCLSFEQTPTQPQGTLVPDSESESDEERSKIGDRRRKNIVSDSDSYKSSPTCSTFMSPTNKVVPESEDESPITPSSSYKNRTHRVVSLNEEIDININRQEQKKSDALEIVDDSEEEAGNDEAKSAFEDTQNKQPELSKSDPSLTEGVKSTLATGSVPQFNMDSDTDVEEEAAPVTINNAPASNGAHFHMDSDTDADENDTRAALDPPPSSEDTTKHSHTASIPVVQAKAISMDSDTDVEDDDLLSTETAKRTEQQTANAAEEAPEDFHLDSDTDVEEETNISDSKEDETPSRLDIKPDTSTTAARQCLDLDSDTDDEDILRAAVSEASAKPGLEVLSNSDTDVEDEVKPVKTSGPSAAEAKLDSGEDTDVNESVGLPAVEGDAADVSVDSDTDVEDKETDVQEAGDKQIPELDREITPGIQTALQQNCSTPVQEGNIEEMDTQAFLSPSLSTFRRPLPPGRPVAFSPRVNTQEEDDLVVAETQSFILNDRGQNNLKDQSSVLDSSVNEKDVSSTSGGDFQLELSDSSYCQGQALAMESTQAYVTVDPALEETQPYTDDLTSDEKDLPVDIALQATQAYISEPCSDEEEDTAEDQITEPAPCSPVPQSNSATTEAERGKRVDLHVAETLPMCIDEDDDSEDSAPFFRKRKARQIQEDESQTLSNSEVSVSETLPMEIQEDRDSEEDSPPVFRKRKAKQLHLEEEQTQPIDEQSVEEESTDISSKTNVENLEEDEETQPHLDSELTVAPTQPIADSGESDEEESVPVVTKRPRKVQTQEEEKTQTLCIAATQPLSLREDSSSDDEEPIVAPRKRKAKPLEDTQSLTNTEADSQDTKPSILKEIEGPSEGETSDVNVRKRRGGGKLGKEKQETTEDAKAEPQTRRTKGKNKAVPVSRGRRGKAKVQLEDESAEEETQVSKEDDTKEQMRQKEKEEMERLEKEKEEKAAKIKKEKEQSEMLEREKREREEKKRLEKEEKERLEAAKRAKEELQRQEEERKEQEKKAQLEMEEKERLEAAKRAEEELQRQEEERKEQEKKAQLEMEEKERLEKEKQTKEDDQAPRRGRRTARRQTAAPDSTTLDDVPAKRTRSRSNSSNSLSSERSVSSVTSQNSKVRGRGRGGRRSEVPTQKTPARASNRRRTVAAETTTQTTEMSAASPGSVSRSNSQLSEISVSSVSSQAQGRGGRQRGRGRRAEPEPESVQSVQMTIEKSLQRGRKIRKISPENDEGEKTVSQQSSYTRGQDGATEGLSKCTPDAEEDQTHHDEAATSSTVMQKVDISSKENPDERRRGRKRQTEAETKKETKDFTTEETEQKDENPSVKRKAVARNTPAKKSVKDLIDDNIKSEKPKGRGRASVVQKKKKSEEDNDNDSADSNSMKHEEATPKVQEVPQTPTSTVSRKRQSAISESSPVAKTPRSTSASPSTVGRRAASQTYKVLFTGVVDEAGEKVLSRLGGSIAKDVSDMNCLVTDKVRRTVKFLCAVAKGVPIVTTQWLEKCGKAGTFLSTAAYIVKDREQEQKFNFSLQESLKIANSQPLLQGYEIHVTKSVRPEPVQMKDIITCSGAIFLPKMPSSNKPQTLVISCEEDWSLCGPAVSSALPVLTAEFILTGILQQKLDFETHKLSGPAQTAGGRGRSRKK